MLTDKATVKSWKKNMGAKRLKSLMIIILTADFFFFFYYSDLHRETLEFTLTVSLNFIKVGTPYFWSLL